MCVFYYLQEFSVDLHFDWRVILDEWMCVYRDIFIERKRPVVEDNKNEPNTCLWLLFWFDCIVSVFFCREKMCALVEIEMSFIYCLFVCFSSWWTRFAPNLTEKRENEKIKLKRLTREKNNNRNIEIERCLCLKWFWSWFREKLYGIELLVLSWIWLNWWWRWSVDEMSVEWQ